MGFLILGRSVGLKKKNLKRKEAWYPSIIALESGTTRHEPKVNIAEKSVDAFVKVRQRGKKDQPPNFYVVTVLIFIIKRTI